MFLNEVEPLDCTPLKEFTTGTQDGRLDSQLVEFLVKVGQIHGRWLSLQKWSESGSRHGPSMDSELHSKLSSAEAS